MDVGFIGLGHMGAGMAANLLRAGHRVTVYNRTPSRARPLVEQRARAPRRGCETPAAATPSSRCWRTTPASRRSCSATTA